MIFLRNKWIISTLAILAALSMLLSGCTGATTNNPVFPVGSSPASTLQNATKAQPSTNIITPQTTTQASSQPNPIIEPTPSNSSPPVFAGSLDSTVISKIDLSKYPAVGETVDLSYTFKQLGFIDLPAVKIYLQFECYDVALYYPLGKGQFEINRQLSSIAKSSPDSGKYIRISEANNTQPKYIVPEKDVVISGEISWEGNHLKQDDEVSFTARIRFPREGEWGIVPIVLYENGTTYLIDEARLTVNKDSGYKGWSRDYSPQTGVMSAFPNSPVGVLFKIDQAPLVGEEMPLDIVLYTIEDSSQPEVSFLITKEGKGVIPVDSVIVKSDTTWQGILKKGERVNLPVILKYPEEGDYTLWIMVRPNPGALRQGMGQICVHAGKDSSRFGWVTDYDKINNNPMFPGTKSNFKKMHSNNEPYPDEIDSQNNSENDAFSGKGNPDSGFRRSGTWRCA